MKIFVLVATIAVLCFAPVLLKAATLIAVTAFIIALMVNNSMLDGFQFDSLFKMQLVAVVVLVFAIAAALQRSIDEMIVARMEQVLVFDTEVSSD